MSELKDQAARRTVGPKVEKDTLPDLDRFEANENFVVEAAAGSGKTTALIGRMVALVREGWSPKKIAAITFTREASGEMRAEFQEGLRATRDIMRKQGNPKAGRIEEALQED